MPNELIPAFSNIRIYLDQPLDDLDWESLVSLGMEARVLKDFSQWMLGKLAGAVEIKYGTDSLGKFATEIGVRKSSLLVYRWVVKQLEKFIEYKDLPESHLSFSSYQIAAGTENPKEWIDKANDNNWSVEQLHLEIKMDKDPNYQPKPKKIIICPRCKFEFKLGA